MALTERLAQVGISLADLTALLAARSLNGASPPSPPPPPPQPQLEEQPDPVPVKVINENTYKEGAHHQQPSTFGKGKIHIMRTSRVTAPTVLGTRVGFAAAPGNLDLSFFAFIKSLQSKEEGEMYIEDFQKRMEKKFPKMMPGNGNVLGSSSSSSQVRVPVRC
ncbi:hypothetical protein EST38_g13402 [Candolleomyces aberdarensis]|uniref:Uncharacterized protein n=1 Tax=Candolleomyces aberdarensis TaxID=2316362 RepID=A0A4Q2D130_9AGAR|nr:hypothetical protein EST38_g13402 [Candolleomyces aberdarensis]